ncbi:MAG: hypothetical protein WC700_14245 [Gemmatimonadaceae bacterium]
MSSEPPTILGDTRTIQYVLFPGGGNYHVGLSNVTRIEAYGESGEFCPVPWLRVWEGDFLAVRFPASQVSG